METITFSAIIPLFNKKATIARAIESVLRQTYQPSEIIIVDDGSTDGSAEQVQKQFGNSITLVKQENRGPAAARNAGARLAASNYLAFLDADDEWRDDFLEKQSDLIRRFPTGGLFIAAYRVVAKNYQRVQPRYPRLPTEGIIADYLGLIEKYDTIGLISSSVTMPTHVFRRLDGFPEHIYFSEDAFFWIKVALHFPVVFTRYCGATINLQDSHSNPFTSKRCFTSFEGFLRDNPVRYLFKNPLATNIELRTNRQLINIAGRSLIDIAAIHALNSKSRLAEQILSYVKDRFKFNREEIRERVLFLIQTFRICEESQITPLLNISVMKNRGLEKAIVGHIPRLTDKNLANLIFFFLKCRRFLMRCIR